MDKIILETAQLATRVWRNSLPTHKANAQRLLRQAPKRYAQVNRNKMKK